MEVNPTGPLRCPVLLGGVPLWLRLRYAETAAYFDRFRTDAAAPVSASPLSAAPVSAAMTDGDWALWRAMGHTDSAFGEFSMLPIRVSEALMAYDRFILHAAAFRLRGRAYLITAGSGVGKTTQLGHLLSLLPGDAAVICGDRPVIELCADGSAVVHPSPWNGKEDLYGADAAPLGGLIVLRRDGFNAFESIDAQRAAPYVFASVFQSCETEDSIRRAANAASRLLESAAVYRLTSRDVPDSTRLMADALCKEAIVP